MTTTKKILRILFPVFARKLCFFCMGICLFFGLVVSLWEVMDYNVDDDRNVSIVLDVSLSMNVLDGDREGNSRLGASKKKIQDIVTKIPGKVWLTIFSWSAERIIPHTSDKGLFITFLAWLDRENVSEGGTSIEIALENAILDFTDEKSGYIILFTDGGEHEWKNLSVIKKSLTRQNITPTIIWVGTQEGWYIPYSQDVFWRIHYKMYDGKKVVSSLWEKWLQSLAKQLWGKYYHISDNIDIESITDTTNISQKIGTRSIWWGYIAFALWLYFLIHIYIYKNIFWYKIWKK